MGYINRQWIRLCAFSLAMMLFGLRTSNTHDAAELSGMAQSVGYLLAAIGPTLFGYLHDATNGWKIPLIVMFVTVGFASGRDQFIGQTTAKDSL